MLTAVQKGRVNVVMVQRHLVTTLQCAVSCDFCKITAVLITTETDLQYELYLTGVESARKTGKRVGRLSMRIDPFPVRLEQELRNMPVCRAGSAAANGRLPRDICQLPRRFCADLKAF